MLTDEQKQRLYDEITQEISHFTSNPSEGFSSAEDVDDTHPVLIDVLGESNYYNYFITVDFAKFAVIEVDFDEDNEYAAESESALEPYDAAEHIKWCHHDMDTLAGDIQSVLDKFKDKIER